MYPNPDPMDLLAAFVFKGAISFGIIYAWTIGYNRPSKFRAGNARNMKEEFAVYGFPGWVLPDLLAWSSSAWRFACSSATFSPSS